MKRGWNKRRRRFMKKRFVPYWLRQRDALAIAVHRLRQLFYEDIPKAMDAFIYTLVDCANKIYEAIKMGKMEGAKEE